MRGIHSAIVKSLNNLYCISNVSSTVRSLTAPHFNLEYTSFQILLTTVLHVSASPSSSSNIQQDNFFFIMLHVRNGSLRTHYEVLSVNENASYDEMREKYKVAILSSHPDKLCGKSVTSHPIGNQQEIFLSVQKAWEVLSDPKSRQNYDNILQASRNEVEVIDNEVRLEEMMVQVDGDMKELSYQCRCGDYFLISSAELEELGVSVENTGNHFLLTNGVMTQASVVLPCDSCSLKIRLMIDVNDDPSI